MLPIHTRRKHSSESVYQFVTQHPLAAFFGLFALLPIGLISVVAFVVLLAAFPIGLLFGWL